MELMGYLPNSPTTDGKAISVTHPIPSKTIYNLGQKDSLINTKEQR